MSDSELLQRQRQINEVLCKHRLNYFVYNSVRQRKYIYNDCLYMDGYCHSVDQIRNGHVGVVYYMRLFQEYIYYIELESI